LSRLAPLVALVLGACASQRPVTEIFLVLDAEPSLRTEATSLRVVITGSRLDGTPETALDRTLSGGELVWPTTVGIVPRGNDSTRGVRVEASLVTGSGGTARVSARTTFLPEETRVLRLDFEACCVGMACATNETCEACLCVTDAVDPIDLPADAGP
jgi:hypothetical protein